MSSEEKYWDAVAARYNGLYDNDWSRFEDSQSRVDIGRLLERAPGVRVLDIGCGAGLGYELLRSVRSDVDYVGIDISGAMIDELKKKYPTAKVLHASGDDLALVFDSCQFDMVMAINVSASFPLDTTRMISGVRSVLSPGGWFYLSFLNRYSLRRLTRGLWEADEPYRTRGDSESDDFVWAKTYSANALLSLCRESGFRNVHCVYRSVLGGVWESPAAISVERGLQGVAPCLGHAVAVYGRKASSDEQVEAVPRS